ncbi:hypothetical protein, partial [Streptomyces halstedii]|uniref:hypothetical protein n=1 Tax=Streptomyces halstedii TaxID=1944 RepID=UPI0033B66646
MTTQPEPQPLRGELHPAQLLAAEPDAPPFTTETVRGGRRLGTQPERLHHLLDRARRGVILPAEGEQLAALVRAREERLALLENGARERSALLEEARDTLEAAGINEAHGGESWPRLVPAIEELAAERDRAQRSATLHTDAHRTATRRADALEAELRPTAARSATRSAA